MNTRTALKYEILKHNAQQSDALIVEIFRLQYAENPVYREYVQHLGISPQKVQKITDIPFLPIGFFKTQDVICKGLSPKLVFTSSGTTGAQTSRHLVADPDFYTQHATQLFEEQYGSLKNFQILALLPSYLERTGSSLVYMVEQFMQRSGTESGFYLHNFNDLSNKLRVLQNESAQVLLIGVTFALLDFAAEHAMPLGNAIVMETGGMKGRKKELLRAEVHKILRESFLANAIHAEYGMTELISQAYSKGNGMFATSASFRVVLREVNDPLDRFVNDGKTGGINVIDLGNLDSCSFVETQDLGILHENGKIFEVIGRYDAADLRGCNLLTVM